MKCKIQSLMLCLVFDEQSKKQSKIQSKEHAKEKHSVGDVCQP